MESTCLDRSVEVSEIRTVDAGRRAWLAAGIDDSDWRIEPGAAVLAEIDALLEHLRNNPLELLRLDVNDFELPGCAALMARMKEVLDNGVGFAVIDRLPVDRHPVEELLKAFWLLGQYIGRPVAQKWNGQMIYEVRDTGQAYGYGVRGSYTNVELVFHTDNAFGRMVPDYVGLFCRNAAKAGGVSRFCSLYTVHDRLHRQYPAELGRLYQPMLFDRQKEHAAGAAPVTRAPFFSWHGDRLYARANTSLVRKGYAVAGETMDEALAEALVAVDTVCASGDLWYEAPLEPGQVQYLNNHEIGHYRSRFEDYDEPERKRHLFRLWHRAEGGPTYDGVACRITAGR